MGKTIKFNTGRGYSKEGQIIVAEEFGDYETFDWFAEEDQADQYIIFKDKTRGIQGRIPFCKLEEGAIMRNYDIGNYINY